MCGSAWDNMRCACREEVRLEVLEARLERCARRVAVSLLATSFVMLVAMTLAVIVAWGRWP